MRSLSALKSVFAWCRCSKGAKYPNAETLPQEYNNIEFGNSAMCLQSIAKGGKKGSK